MSVKMEFLDANEWEEIRKVAVDKKDRYACALLDLRQSINKLYRRLEIIERRVNAGTFTTASCEPIDASRIQVQPRYGDLCWFWGDRGPESAYLAEYKEYKNGMYLTKGISLGAPYCQPVLPAEIAIQKDETGAHVTVKKATE